GHGVAPGRGASVRSPGASRRVGWLIARAARPRNARPRKMHRLEDLVIPDDLHYTAEHEWVKVVADGVRIGITDHAQEALGDIVFVTLPAPGTQVVSGQTLGEVESTKSVSDI